MKSYLNLKIIKMPDNLIKLPGLIDVHTHLRDPGGTQKEDFETGTKAAVAGGYTQILDMPNNIPPTDNPQRLAEKYRLAKKRIWCDIGFNFAGTKDSIKYFSQIKNKVFGLKIYMNQTTGTLLVKNNKEREAIFKAWDSPLPIMVHAEGETIVVAISLAKKYGKKLHICHVTFDQLNEINKAKKSGVDISCEVCPHHLFLSKEDVKRLGTLGIMKPPLLNNSDREKLWENLNLIDMISTDHAPHTLEEKYDKSSPKYGVPGLETTLPLLISAYKNQKISLNKIIDMTYTAPKKIFRIPDQVKTFIDVDVSKEFTIESQVLFTKCAWTPFAGMKGAGKVKRVVLRGKTIFDNGVFVGNPGGKITTPTK